MKPISILALQQTPNVGKKTVEKILSIPDMSEPECPSDLIDILKRANSEFGRILVPDIKAASIGWNKANEILKNSQRQGIEMISRDNVKYPNSLLSISDPPILLHVKGNIDALNKDSIAIVGTRKPTDFSLNQANKIAGIFAEEGYIIVSGLADGIDSAAHKGALEKNGLTVAVLAHGLDTIYPYKNKELADEIIKKNGTIVSEYPFGTKTFPSYFVERDRIQSGLSMGVFVIETGIKGGTMHTVRFCEKQGRILIVMKQINNSINAQKRCGNTRLINDGRADIVFEKYEDMIVLRNAMHKKKEELFALKSTSQIIPSFKINKVEQTKLELVPAHELSHSIPIKCRQMNEKKKGRSTDLKLADFI